MTRPSRSLVLLALVALAVGGGIARGDGVAQVMTAKTLPAATIAVIDPESGSSTGGGTTDVRVAPGDVILFRFKYFPVPDKIVRGLQGYLTEYIPANTEVVGVRIIDASGLTIKPRYPGIATDSCGGACGGFGSVPSASGPRNLDDGSISQVYADTGIFYTTDARLTRNPSAQFLALGNGILMSPEPQNVGSVIGILGATSPVYSHNGWDWIQERAYGIPNPGGNASGNNGRGNTPYRYGSPVAGPGTYYTFEATEPSPGTIQFNDVGGPWQRVAYPGSQIGSGLPVTGSGPLQRMNLDTAAGFDVKPATPLAAGTRAVRIALGEVRVGEPGTAEIALRVLATPLDPVQGRDVDCAEVFGGDTSAASTTVRAKDNLWPTYLASPACVYLNLLFDLDVDRTLAVVGDTLTYTLHGKNLSTNPQTGVVRKLKYDTTRVSYQIGSATGGATVVPSCDGDGLDCLVWPTATLQPSDEYLFTALFTVGGGGQVTSVMRATYRSDQLPGGFGTQSVSMTRQVAVIQATLASTTPSASPGGTTSFTGTIGNSGSGDAAFDDLTIALPTGWTIAGAVTLGGTPLGCAGATCTIGQTLAGGVSRTLAFTANVPAGTPTGLYDVDLQIWASQAAFGGRFETYFPDLATAAVGQVRSTPPVISCPVLVDATTVSGTTALAAGTTIRVYFNLIQRGSGASTAAGDWTVGTFGAGSPFGALYGGLEIRATAQAPGELESVLSAPCEVTTALPCSDRSDNDGDGLIDYPADPGCDSPVDTTEDDPVIECSDGLDNDADTAIDFPADLSCYAPEDLTEGGPPQCSDGADNDGDGLVDFPADAGCTSGTDPIEATLDACQDFADNDGDGLVDFPADPGCHSANDDGENDLAFTPAEVRARLLLAFDTSGSMNWNACTPAFTGGDGSASCPGSDVACAVCGAASCGNATADDSRLYKVKRGLSDVVAAFGEVDYGLMRFHQRATSFLCPTQNASRGSGGWQGAADATCSGGFSAGDLLVSFSIDNPYDLLEWLDGQTNYAGVPPPRLDTELRGSGTTPLAGILTSARTYLAGVRATDTQAGCRPYRVILVTDGAETCGGDPVAAAAALAAAGIPVHVIGFATADVTIQANLNAIASAGGTGSAIFADDATTLSTAIASIVTSTILVELCNGVDDDCDGLIDEDFPDKGAACDNGLVGACLRPGTRVCRADGLGTECNAPGATGTTEVCNGVDDDCDGLIDEGFPLLNTPCDNGLTGMCRTTGSYQCTADGSGTYCTAVPLVGGTEVCNGLDDDCDGLIDEDPLGPPIGGLCGGGGGACTPGTLRCVSGAIECVGGSTGTAEICNGQDDDCDGFIDEPVLPGVGDPCTDPGFETIGDTGECELGQTICAGGMIECGGYVGPRPELCNGRDDDCDGMADDMAPCPAPGDLCVNTVCASPCGTTEFRCPFGFFCQTLPEGDYCLPDRCQDNPCPAGTVCDMVTGECQDACATVTCMPGETCDDGACLDCFDAPLACPAGQVCIAGASGVGACQPDPCFGIPCAAGQFCRDGACQAIDCDPACAPDQLCQDGTCVDNACGDMHLCTGTSCRPGEACHPGTGRCIADPCITTTCPAGYGCQVSCQGTSSCALLPAAPGVDIVAAGGGCACRVGPAPRHGARAAAGIGLAVLALALLLAGRRRR